MRYYIVVDGGGTKTEAVLFSEVGKIISYGKSGSGNALLSTENIASSNVKQAIDEALEKGGIQFSQVEICNLFIPGFKACVDTLYNQIGIECKICSEIDGLIYSCHNGGNGIVVLSGTGSFCFSYIDGEICSVGGWGHLFGDEGSGYYIGMKALQTAAKMFDMNIENKFTNMVNRAYGVSAFKDVTKKVYGVANSREVIASLCEDVCKLAKAGDKYALSIVDEAMGECAKMAVDCYNKSKMSGKAEVALSGGVSSAGEVVLDSFKRKLNEKSCGKLVYCENHCSVLQGQVEYTLMNNKK